MYINLPAIALAYLAGGISGGHSKLGSPLIGLAIGSLIGLPWYYLPLAMLAGWIGEKPSPAKWSHGRILDGQAGNPADVDVMVRKSSRFEWRQQYFEYPNMAFRGLLNALVYLPFYYVVGIHALFPLAYMIGWPLGVFLVRGQNGEGWRKSEMNRQGITAVLIAILLVSPI